MEGLPSWQVLSLVNEHEKRRNREMLWQGYMANVITLLADEAKPWHEVEADLERAQETRDRAAERAELENAKNDAMNIVKALDKAREEV